MRIFFYATLFTSFSYPSSIVFPENAGPDILEGSKDLT